MIATHECQCDDNCGATIKVGDEAIGVKNWYNGEWHKDFRCLECQHERDND